MAERRRRLAGGASTSPSSAPATTASSPRPTWRAPGCARSSSNGARSSAARARPRSRARAFSLAGRLRAQPPAAGGLARLLAARPRARGARGGADPERVPRRRPADAPRRRRETARELARFDRRDARPTPGSGPSWWRSPTCSGRGSTGRRRAPRAGSGAARCAAIGRSLGAARRHGLAAAKLFATSARDHLEQRFRSEHVGAALGWDAISNTLAGPSTPGTAYSLLHEHAAASLGGSPGGSSAAAWAPSPRCSPTPRAEAGAEIVTGAPVERILVEGGRAAGLQLADGAELAATTVVSNADPKRTLLGLVGRDRLDPATAEAIEAYRCDGASLKINLALGELPRIEGTPAGVQPHHRGLVQFTLPLAGMDADQEGARHGIPAPAPHVELCVPSALDPSLAPPGRHVATLGFRSQPYRLAESDWDSERERVADRLLDDLATMIPNLPGADHRPPGAHPARPRAHPGADRRPPPPRRHVARPARPAAPGDRARRLPDADRRPLSLRRRHPPRRRRHGRQRSQLRAPRARRPAAVAVGGAFSPGARPPTSGRSP